MNLKNCLKEVGPDHFEGLLKAIREENSTVYSHKVETRDLKKYDGVA